ncbi:hypothetical protein CMI39_01415 [Candidatus Pacearchaeota archaeon]|jgi:flagellin-like protein|nr:hypothetical protein [Candidatus Pacearchaeota archaeon]|tara:strand:+ start:113 stop:568 length:456 start_codon:yes stop_codon:yes gene_type:complete
MKKKGVSPVIATVLLVAIVVVIGLIIFQWFRGMTQESIVKFDKNIGLVCSDVNFDTRYSANTLYITNNGNVPIYNIRIKLSGEGHHETKDITDLSSSWPESGLNQGGAFSGEIDIGNSNKITLIPVLRGESELGEKNFVCDEKQHGYELII